MSPKQPHPEDQPSDQGRLFPAEMTADSQIQIGEVVEGGIYPDEMPVPEEGVKTIDEVVREAVAARQQSINRREAQRGKHSPLKRDGHYGNIQPGDVLPNHGPVRDRDWETASQHADQLDQARLREQAAQPSLLEETGIVQGLGQVAHEASRAEYNPDEQRSFTAIPNLLAIKPDLNYGIAMEDVSNVKITSLGKRLFGRGLRTVDNIRLSPTEFGSVGLSTERLLERAENRASKKYETANPVLRREHELRRRIDAGRGLESRQGDIVTKLQSELDTLGTLLGYVKNPNLRRAKDVDTRVMAAEAWGSIESMLKVAAESTNETTGLEKWTLEEYEGARQAVLRALTTGPHAARMTEWKRLLTFTYDYTRAKKAVFTPRLEEVKQRQQADSTELAELLAEHGFATQ